ncbi:MAG: chromosome partitioning protein ParA [Alphaproteobacteria bacterium]|jgi:chromosome partitioning protein|nr:chromosome partitioning protein ParA [Alphaproteobacteria bacterium]MBN59132.1 chromosome partitioning protein ParA [Oceanospirillaceae bacterium]MAJ64491.1 chromosome partitioning protein ParA [Alphaproteobacteria bacterium]MAJ64523.1 chromosome partitioning protein ParA [Alphaproteobacteria bacterium]MAS48277.1 chromosome partitioning protein ParA [Alphaproteobacteria bacterium]|tara:strand:+ start:797 stop:1486 length:690 start_codon:yes stop_codon:yes gene_type:complete
MPVISFANSKGGSGKTTSALVLACELAHSKPVTIIDADPRHPVTTWAKLPNKPENLTVITNQSEKTILDEIEQAAARDPFVIVDLEGTASRLTSYAISQSDLVIVPMKEQQQDAMAAIDIIAEIHRDMKAVRRDIPYAVLFTQSKVVAKSRTARFVAKQFRDNPRIETFQTEIHERDAFAALYAAGGGVRDLNPKEVNNLPSAIENVSAFAAEVIERLRANQANQAEVA